MKDIKTNGILFSFTTDPMLPETRDLTMDAVGYALSKGVPVQILTKDADWLSDFQRRCINNPIFGLSKDKIAFGFTLTGCDDLEPHASPNQERIEAMRKLHSQGFKTFASIEPVVEPQKSIEMIEASKDCCDIFKVGLMSGKKDYKLLELKALFKYLSGLTSCKIYLKGNLVKYLGIDRNSLPIHFIRTDYNMFNKYGKLL